MCQGLFFNKVAGLRPAVLLKKRFWHRCFPVNFVRIPKFLRILFFTKHLWTTVCPYGMLPVVIIKTKTVSLFLQKNLICQYKNITSINMTIKKWNNLRGQFLLFS